MGAYHLPTLDFNSLTGIFVVYGGMLVLAFAYMAAAACARHVRDTLKRGRYGSYNVAVPLSASPLENPRINVTAPMLSSCPTRRSAAVEPGLQHASAKGDNSINQAAAATPSLSPTKGFRASGSPVGSSDQATGFAPFALPAMV